MADDIERGRAAFARRQWSEAHALLAGAVDVEDVEWLAIAAHLSGRDAEALQIWERLHRMSVDAGALEHAARHAAWLAFAYLLRGEEAHSSGWLARAERLLEQGDPDCVARGWALLPPFLQAWGAGDQELASSLAAEILRIGRVCADDDVAAMGVLCSGEAALIGGDVDTAMRHFDDVMVSITADEVSVITAGIVYCAVIDNCMNAFDLRRAAEWTAALHAWCEAQPDLVPYRGQCLVHRSQVLLANGEWAAAVSEAERAEQLLSQPAHPALGMALYQRGELHRLHGELSAAEQTYRAANRRGREPVPGLALLRLAAGDVPAALAAIRRMMQGSRGTLGAPPVLAAAVDVFLAADDRPAAQAASDELSAIAEQVGAPLLRAMAEHARGALLLVHGDATAALRALHEAQALWRTLGMPYDEARTRVLVGLACRTLGDADAAELELDAAADVFRRLRAQPDLDRVEALAGSRRPGGHSTLTARECEVLRLVASGCTNRDVAAELVISEHTVARHVQNIFTKLGVSSRAAATAYAYEHGVIDARRGQN